MSSLTEALPGCGDLLEDPDRETALLSSIAQRVLDRAREAGADAAEVSVSSSLGREVSVRLGEIDVLQEARDRGISVTCYQRRATGTASTGDLSAPAIDEAVRRAVAIASHAQSDPAAGLADPKRLAREFADFDLWHPEPIEMERLIERARAIEQVGLDCDARIDNSEGASVSTEAAVGVYANSHGFLGTGRGTTYGQHCVLVGRGTGGMQRDWDWDRKRRWQALAEPGVTGREAARRTLARLDPRRAPTGRFPVLFHADVAAGLIGHLVGAVSGRNLYRRSSFLLGCVGQQLFPDWVRIVEDPHLRGGARSSAFDSEGVATGQAALVDQGVLGRYVLGSYSARKLGLESTANAGGVRNLVFQPGERTPTELIAAMGRGLLVTEVMGQGVNLVTGDYSRGAAGFWIEHGEIAFPVEEITVAGNLREMFANLQAAANDLEVRRNLQTPSLLIDGLTVAGD